MKKRAKWGRSMIAIGMLLILGSTLFRAIPGVDWTVSAAIVLSALVLIIAGLLLTR